MIVGVPSETYPGEKRVALVPALLPQLKKRGYDTIIQSGAGLPAGYTDEAYREKGAEVVPDRAEVFRRAGIILQVRGLGANPDRGASDLPLLRPGQVLIAFMEPLTAAEENRKLAQSGATTLSMELMPRITRAQSMDALSSMATVAGYEAVLLAATHLPKMFPMMMTAAGTIAPARVFVIGAGVAGLQAIASSKRLGAIVEANDVRSAVKEQVESLGAKFVEMPLETGAAEGSGGYARAMDEEFYRRQREFMKGVIAASDVVITTAAVPGKKAPILVTAEMVAAMQPGSVVVDIAAERGGNCELTRPGETVIEQGVTILGPENLPSRAPYHASQMYAKNIVTFLLHLTSKEGALVLDGEDEILKGTVVTQNGEIVHPRVREAMGLVAQEQAV